MTPEEKSHNQKHSEEYFDVSLREFLAAWYELREASEKFFPLGLSSWPHLIGDYAKALHIIERLEAENADLRQAEKFTVKVEIPETTSGGCCNENCLFACSSYQHVYCFLRKEVNIFSMKMKPGPGCPRYEVGK
jgi:hypothetical protein